MTLKLVVSARCVVPGARQTLSFHARPRMNVVLDTRYADDKDGQVHGGFDYNHFTDAAGDYRLSWIVDPLTPVGPADSLVGAVDRYGRANGRVEFRVARSC
jgi:hypothetical protein